MAGGPHQPIFLGSERVDLIAADPISPSHQSICFYDDLTVKLSERCVSMMGCSAADFLAMSSCSCLLKATRVVLALDADHRMDELHKLSSFSHPLLLSDHKHCCAVSRC